MSNDDNPIGTALWLVAGGAAGFAAGRWIVAPLLAERSTTLPASSSPASIALVAMTQQRPSRRSLGTGPSGPAAPIDPYADPAIGSFATASIDVVSSSRGPSGEMRPIDPYTQSITVPVITSGPATVPAVVPARVTARIAPIPLEPPTSTQAPGASAPITMPSQLVVAGSASAARRTAPRVPITHPSQLVQINAPLSSTTRPTAPTGSTPQYATAARVRRFDTVFARYRGTLPIEYVRALVERESNGQPSARAGSAIGLMQIVPVVLADYNKRHGTTYRTENLTDPAINVAIGCELLRLIVDSYRTNHPHTVTLQENWDDPRFVELLTFGYNAGFSESGGVGRVARYLEKLGAIDITIDQVSAHATLAGASKHLSNHAKVAWCKGVAALYQRERALTRPFASS
jgi:soluble lytic murein transglycosylase-like protein